MMEKEQESFINWDFKESDTKQFTHGYHTYPAMMIPQIARRLIHLYGKNAKTLLDPFMGSGTSLVEASLTPQIKEAFGFDLNPLAVLIAKVKTTSIITEGLEKILNKILVAKEHNGIPDFKNIEFWFKPDVIEKLAVLKTAINKIKDQDVKDFFLVAFSETVRNVSNTRNSEFKLYRMAEKNLIKHSPQVFKEFEKITSKNIKGMEEYNKARQEAQTTAILGSSMLDLKIKPQSINLIVTSPPYGDSRTTVAYGQFSRLALQWLDYEDVASLDNRLLGGKASKELEVKINSPTLKGIIKKIAEKDEKRAREVLSFYEDFDRCVDQLNRVMAKGGYVCFVVGNRTVKGVNIPTDKIMSEMFMAKNNYQYITTHLRNIPNKRMPSLNSPSNKVGEKVTTMCNEFIFVLRKV
ncbi:MAG: DNA methyltransferase [archaeon]